MKNNVVLTGMPGAGKSTAGVLLAKEAGKGFIDTDVAIQVREGETLQEILNGNDYLYLRDIEESVLLETGLSNHVIATGGSAVYSQSGMQHLAENAVIIYLDVALQTLRQRIHNFDTRGIARAPDQSFEALFEERSELYRRYAEITISCDEKPIDQVVAEIMAALVNYGLSKA